jgi:hypothetical protein
MLKIKDIEDSYVARKNQREKYYDNIVEQISQKIKKTVRLNQNLFMFFEVPMFQFGCPLYNIEECIGYIQNQLIEGGFVVKYFFPNILYISWNPQELIEMKDNRVKAVLASTTTNRQPQQQYLVDDKTIKLQKKTGGRRRLTLDI